MRSRFLGAGLWLAPAVLLWGALAVLARIPTRAAAGVTDVLFVLALPLTYLAVVAAIVASSARPRRAAGRAAAVTLGLVLAVALLETMAAARLVHWELVAMWLSGEPQEYVPDPDLGFRHQPGRRWSRTPRGDVEVGCGLRASRSDRITATFDARGYRNPTTLSRADVVLIGDSYVAGQYVSDEQVLSRVLQARLGRPVANLGVAGYGTAQELVVLQKDAVALAPRVAIWFFYEGNDLYNDQEFENVLLARGDARASAWTAGHGWWRRSLVRNGHAHLRLALQRVVPSYCPYHGMLAVGPHRGQRILFGPEAAVPWTDFERDRWDKARDTLREAMKTAREHDIHLMLVYVPLKFRVYRPSLALPSDSDLRHWTLWPLPDLFARFCRAEQLACLDLTDLLAGAVRAGGMPHAIADSHWSADGHRLVAERLAETLESLGWLAPR